ncbi:MAG: hypothetical protein LIP23_07245, partial [Planctomycetes bacterium]|nr:hypothetical protein [Planctomycetota bacterium]
DIKIAYSILRHAVPIVAAIIGEANADKPAKTGFGRQYRCFAQRCRNNGTKTRIKIGILARQAGEFADPSEWEGIPGSIREPATVRASRIDGYQMHMDIEDRKRHHVPFAPTSILYWLV